MNPKLGIVMWMTGSLFNFMTEIQFIPSFPYLLVTRLPYGSLGHAVYSKPVQIDRCLHTNWYHTHSYSFFYSKFWVSSCFQSFWIRQHSNRWTWFRNRVTDWIVTFFRNTKSRLSLKLVQNITDSTSTRE